MNATRAPTFASPPSRALLALATLPTQVLGAAAFALALVWIVELGVRDTTTISVLAVGTTCVFAGGAAYRGSILALALCAVLDTAIAVALLAQWSYAVAVVSPPLPISETHFVLGRIIAGCVAAIIAAECLVAIPQVRQFARWRDAQFRRG